MERGIILSEKRVYDTSNIFSCTTNKKEFSIDNAKYYSILGDDYMSKHDIKDINRAIHHLYDNNLSYNSDNDVLLAINTYITSIEVRDSIKEITPTENKISKTNNAYNLDIVKVNTHAHTNNNLTLISYTKSSMICILEILYTDISYIKYLGDIRNNKIVAGPFKDIDIVFENTSNTFVDLTLLNNVKCTAHVDEFGSISYFPIHNYKYNYESENDFIFNDIVYKTQNNSINSDFKYLQRKGDLIIINSDNKKYTINNSNAVSLGFSLKTSDLDDNCIMLDNKEKYTLNRVSNEYMLIRDNISGTEQYISLNSRMLFESSCGTLLGGVFFIYDIDNSLKVYSPHEITISVPSFKLDDSTRVYNNGVYFIKHRLLFINDGKYITDIDYNFDTQDNNDVIGVIKNTLYYKVFQ